MSTLLTPDQVCERLRIKKSTLYQWVNTGFMPYIKVGALLRFSETSLEDWIHSREKRPYGPRAGERRNYDR